ncbi:hypothetical protein CK203_044541 [Vitis vinifera]|uniref:NB-ARC domain-containing protein n=1 Tax=Vitis vinifera TaxID=29760 RepID=A0A438HB66_VITVI|nr:hypothetical protein CK203_044541 [Vitis vinifera]
MDALQVIASATQIVSGMVGAIGALEQASRNLDEAPKRVRSLEDFVCDLENLTQRIKQKHAYKLHNPQKARRIVSKSRAKNLAKVVWTSVAGDPLEKLVNSIRDDLNWWLESQRLAGSVEKVIESTARTIPVRLKIKPEQGYPISSKCNFVRTLLEQDSSHRVILIVGLSGIGKSCLARQVAADPPMKFVDGAVELGFGQWCSRAACNESKDKYQRRLARKICKFLVQIGFWKKIRDENSGDLEYMCCLLQEALYGKSILILLDDVWEQDIVERFAKLYDNNCSYLVTTRNEAVYEITEAQKVELNKDDIKEISKAILLYHSHLSEEEVPGVAESLLERCGHHPLTVAVMGKALRKEIRAEKWEKAIINLSTYATCCTRSVSYVNEKEAENTLTIFRSFEFSLEAMPEDSRRLFIALAALSWAEPVPEACLESVWSVVGQDNLFPLVVCKLVEGSLLMKTDSFPLYRFMTWYHYTLIAGHMTQVLSERFGRKTAAITLEAIIQALMASESISELEASRASFSSILGPRIENLISSDSQDLIAVTAEAVTIIFSKKFGSLDTVDKVLQSILINQLADLLSPNNEEWHESVFTTLMSLIKAGKLNAIERMYALEIDKSLIKLLESGSEVAQHHAIVTLKAFYEVGGPPANGYKYSLAPKPQTFEYLIHKLLDHDIKQVLEAMQHLIPIVEKAGDSRIRKMILQSPLIKRLSELLQYGHSEQNTIRSESAFLLTKLACSGGEPCIKKFLEHDIIPELVKLMHCNAPELQDSSYTALHQMLFGNGGVLIINRMLQMGLIESRVGKQSLLRANAFFASGGEASERRVMKQQVVRKVRAALKGHKFGVQILAALDACVTEGSKGAGSSSTGRQRK